MILRPREWSALSSSPTRAGVALSPVVLAAVLLRASPAKAVAVHRGSMAQFGAGLVAVLVGFESFFLEDNINLVLCFDFLVLTECVEFEVAQDSPKFIKAAKLRRLACGFRVARGFAAR